MTYEEFKQAWIYALRESGLPRMSAHEGTETLNLRHLDRRFESFVEPVGGQQAEPFHVAASLAWRWDALFTARTNSTEEDMLTAVLGRDVNRKARTARSAMRVDVTLSANLPYGEAIPMPVPGSVDEVGAGGSREGLNARRAARPREDHPAREGRATRRSSRGRSTPSPR